VVETEQEQRSPVIIKSE